jgi:transcriptional regulator with XRE-family HTH domain
MTAPYRHHFIGAKVAYWRKRRGKSQRVLAGLAGISQGYLSKIENGTAAVDKRSTLNALAEALQVFVSELTGQPGDPTDPSRAKATASVPDIREALLMREAGESEPSTGDLDALMKARSEFDFAAAAPMVAGLLRGARGADLVQASAAAASVLDQVGYQDLAREAARLCVVASRDTDDTAWQGTAELTRVWCLPPESRFGPLLAARAADEIQGRIGDPRTRRAYGMLHLLAALRSAALRQASDALAHLAEADEVATSLGEPDDWNDLAQTCFGPSNVAMWRVATLAELGDTEKAAAAGETVAPERIPLRHRQASFLLDRMVMLGSAGRDNEAVISFLRAEALAPQFVRLRPIGREVIGSIYRRNQKRAASPALRRAVEIVALREA